MSTNHYQELKYLPFVISRVEAQSKKKKKRQWNYFWKADTVLGILCYIWRDKDLSVLNKMYFVKITWKSIM